MPRMVLWRLLLDRVFGRAGTMSTWWNDATS
jgi:hypothetical protein